MKILYGGTLAEIKAGRSTFRETRDPDTVAESLLLDPRSYLGSRAEAAGSAAAVAALVGDSSVDKVQTAMQCV